MSDETPSLPTLSTKLCPWLLPALEQLDAARSCGRLGHGWLLAAPAGTGKINLALVLAARLLDPRAPAGMPPALTATEAVAAMRDRHVPADHHPDLHWLFPDEDKRTIAVEQIRDAAEALTLKSHRGGAKVVIIEPADGMTGAAANALLKTLEEPSGDTYLILVSHQPERLPATIRSRCQRLNLERPTAEELSTWVGVAPAELGAAWLLTGGAPLLTAAVVLEGNSRRSKGLRTQLAEVSKDTIDVQTVASAWTKDDPELALTWLTRELHLEIRRRLAPAGSTSVTDPDGAILHNAWAELPLRRLFEQYETAERLLNQLGAGLNLELGLQALLVGFQGTKGQ